MFQNLDGILRLRQRPVGVLAFPVCFYDFVIDPGDLPFHLEVVMFEIDVLPLQAEQLASPETGCQLHVVHLEYPAVSGLSKEGVHLFNGQCFHLPMFQLRRDLLR